MNAKAPPMLPQAILFDMDGTLTEPYLNFAQIKKEMGIANQPILESLMQLPPEARRAAEAVLHRHEEEAAANSALNPGCVELLNWLEKIGMKTALITRNSRRSVDTVFARHGLHFDVCITREDGKFKPDPAPLRLACARLDASEKSTWMVGDGYHDIEAGIAAGTKTVWISHNRPKDFSADPWLTVPDLIELTKRLQQCLSP